MGDAGVEGAEGEYCCCGGGGWGRVERGEAHAVVVVDCCCVGVDGFGGRGWSRDRRGGDLGGGGGRGGD